MKKLIGALALAAMVATSAFAEVSFGAWLCALPTIVGFDGEDVKGAGISNPWGYGARTARLDINWTSDDGKAGMTMGVYNDAKNGLGAADAADFWIKPVDAVQITVGQMDNFTGLRGDLCYGSWNWLRPNTWKVEDEGLTFSGISDLGLGIQLFPVEGLQVFASLPMTEVSGKSSAALSRMDKAFGNGKIGSFPIVGIVMILIVILFTYITTSTKFGKKIYAIGSNRKGAGMAGINTELNTVMVFVICGILVGTAAFVWIGMTASSDPATTGKSYEMYAIASAVLGGISMSGGKGKNLGVLFGAMSYTVIDKIIVALKMDSLINDSIKGIILLLVIAIQILGPQIKNKLSKN